ncbi:MAG: SAM-dependent methyltransferase [Bacteroidetes bacterium]|nr:MAG: SAM-dependent methyltransferase [Bacteroidota bacterium]
MSKDLFSQQASAYAKYRPGYPSELIEHILSFVPSKEVAWDCATGNGQAASLLTPYFKKIFATDISEKQIAQAILHPAIQYSVGSGELTNFPDSQFDLITVAQAYHWFQFKEFSIEAIRVGKPGAVIAIWGYGLLQSNVPELNNQIRYYYRDVMGAYWDPERKFVDEEYKTLPFYFDELPPARFEERVSWTFADFVGYLNTWSSLQHYIRANATNPVENFSNSVQFFWTEKESQEFSFPIFLRMGRIIK